MKNKKILYILLPGVIIIWGLVFFKLFNFIGDDKGQLNYSEISKTVKMDLERPDTFSLKLNYKDPFLERSFSYENNNVNHNEQSSSSESKRSISHPTRSINWPEIKYSGIVKNIPNDKTVCMVKIKGKEDIMRTGDIKSDIKLYKVFKDSIIVLYQDQKKTILLNK